MASLDTRAHRWRTVFLLPATAVRIVSLLAVIYWQHAGVSAPDPPPGLLTMRA
jgi:hypothetical protein